MASIWRFVQPGENQVAVVLHDSANENRIWVVPLDLVYRDREGFTVRIFQQPKDLTLLWRWRKNVR